MGFEIFPGVMYEKRINTCLSRAVCHSVNNSRIMLYFQNFFEQAEMAKVNTVAIMDLIPRRVFLKMLMNRGGLQGTC